MNKVELCGNLGSDIEVKDINENFSVGEVSLATREKWTDKNTNEEKEETDWHSIKFLGSKMIEKTKEFSKGSYVKIVGKIKYDEYTDKNESKQKRAYIHCFTIEPGPEKSTSNNEAEKS